MKAPAWLTGLCPRREREPDYYPNPEILAAQEHAACLVRRADSVVPRLEGRLRRNHWGETVASIARRNV